MKLSLRTRHGLAVMGFVLVALLVAACGSSGNSGSGSGSANSGSANAGSPATGTNASASSSNSALSVAKGSAGTYLVGAKGRALYLWEADSTNKSHCAGSCLSVWPAATVSGKPQLGHGVNASDVGTIMTAGKKQLTYDGHPLYYYAGDTSAGSTRGQGSNGFGAKWWLVTPSGSAITSSGGSSGSSGSGGPYSGSGGSSGPYSGSSGSSGGSGSSGSGGGSSWG